MVDELGAFQRGLPDGHKEVRSEERVWKRMPKTAQGKLALDAFILTPHSHPNRLLVFQVAVIKHHNQGNLQKKEFEAYNFKRCP